MIDMKGTVIYTMSSKFDMSWEGFTDDAEGWEQFPTSQEIYDMEQAKKAEKMPNMENKEISKIQIVREAFSLADAVYKYYDGEKHKDDCLCAALNLIEHNDIECFTDELFN
jgi:hypothetical protein